jgi:hypothetical protein
MDIFFVVQPASTWSVWQLLGFTCLTLGLTEGLDLAVLLVCRGRGEMKGVFVGD